jgi:hypothetical protein
MEISDKHLNITHEKRLKSLRSGIDSYIAAHYRSPYVEHDIDLEECAEDDIFEHPCTAAIQSKGAFNRKTFSPAAPPFCTGQAIDDFLKQQSETFSHMLLRMIDEKNLKDSEVYRNANIDRRLFSKIRGDEEYIPSKKTAICFCMALQLDIIQSKKLLEAAGYALSTSSKFDLIVMYLLENKEYNVTFANIVLESYGEGSLTR